MILNDWSTKKFRDWLVRSVCIDFLRRMWPRIHWSSTTAIQSVDPRRKEHRSLSWLADCYQNWRRIAEIRPLTVRRIPMLSSSNAFAERIRSSLVNPQASPYAYSTLFIETGSWALFWRAITIRHLVYKASSHFCSLWTLPMVTSRTEARSLKRRWSLCSPLISISHPRSMSLPMPNNLIRYRNQSFVLYENRPTMCRCCTLSVRQMGQRLPIVLFRLRRKCLAVKTKNRDRRPVEFPTGWGIRSNQCRQRTILSRRAFSIKIKNS